MKKMIAALMAMMMVLSMAACSKPAEPQTQTQPQIQQEQQQGQQNQQNQQQNAQQKEQPTDYRVKVTLGGKEIKSYSLEDIKKLPVSTIEVEGKKEDGPAVAALLKDAGIGKYSKITFKGMLLSEATLSKEQADQDTLLDITNHGTVKLATKAIAKKDWTKDIIEIIVEE